MGHPLDGLALAGGNHPVAECAMRDGHGSLIREGLIERLRSLNLEREGDLFAPGSRVRRFLFLVKASVQVLEEGTYGFSLERENLSHNPAPFLTRRHGYEGRRGRFYLFAEAIGRRRHSRSDDGRSGGRVLTGRPGSPWRRPSRRRVRVVRAVVHRFFVALWLR
jgi:hypothetical protein